MDTGKTARTLSRPEAPEADILEQRLRMAHTIAAISASLARTGDLNAHLNDSLRDVGTLVGADRTHVFQFRQNGAFMDNTHEWCAEGITPLIAELQGLQSGTYDCFMEKLRQGEAFQISDVSALPAEAESEHLILEAQGIRSLLIMPMLLAGRLTGFVGFDNSRDAGEWQPEDIDLLRVISPLIGDALERERSHQAMELSVQRKQAIREGEERYWRLLESLPAIVYRYSQRKGASYWSSQVVDILGFSQQDLLEKPFIWHDAIHPHDLSMVDEAIAAFEVGNRIDLTYRIRDADGSWHWLHDRSIGRLDVEGEVVIEGLAFDITTQKHADEALRESEQRYRGFVEDTPVLICRFLPGGEIIFVNEAYCRYFDKTAEELVGSNFLTLIPGKDRKTVLRNINDLTVDSPTQSHDHRVVTPEGKTRWQHWTNRALFDNEGNIVAYQATGDDITVRMRAERELRDSHSLLKSIIEGTDDGIFLKDIEGRYQLVNPAWASLLGLPDHEIIGNADEEILVAENAQILRNERQTVIAAGDTTSSEKKLQLNGGTRVLLINTSPFRDANGVVVGVIGVCRDITRLKQAQEEAQQRLEQLAHIGRLSTMGEMATGIAHEINQPLHAIANFAAAADAQLAAEEPVSADELRGLLVQISGQAVRAGEIVRRIRNLAKKSKPNPSTVYINKVIEEVVNLVRPEMQSKHIQLDLQLGDGLPTLLGDQIQIQQVVLNLLRNAFDAITESAQPSPEVTVVTAAEEDNFVRITVRDNGTGLPADQPESIFEAFVTTKHNGMGMGLAISRSIAQAHGGRLWAASNPDSGASFHFTLRVA